MDRWLDCWVTEQDRPLVCAGKFKGVLQTERGKAFYPKHILSPKWTQSLRKKWDSRDYLWVPFFPSPLSLPLFSRAHTHAQVHTRTRAPSPPSLFISDGCMSCPAPRLPWLTHTVPGCFAGWKEAIRVLKKCFWQWQKPKGVKTGWCFERRDLFLDVPGRDCVLKIII